MESTKNNLIKEPTHRFKKVIYFVFISFIESGTICYDLNHNTTQNSQNKTKTNSITNISLSSVTKPVGDSTKVCTP